MARSIALTICLPIHYLISLDTNCTLAMDDMMEKVASKTSKRRQSTATGHDSKPQAGDTELLGVYIAGLIDRPCVTI